MQSQLRSHLEESQFIVQSSKLYGGVNGFHDYGTLGFIVKRKLVDLWRKHFLFEEDIFEVETTTLAIPQILKASGHTDLFFDYVIYDKNNKCYRADHLIKDHLKSINEDSDQVDAWNKDKLENYIKSNLTESLNMSSEEIFLQTKNLMFKADDMYLRPETCQHLFSNFEQYLNFYKDELPFGVAQVGKSYRREISPKPFTRLLEFTQAEIEYFFDPLCNKHPKINNIKSIKLPLYSSENQMNSLGIEYMSVEDAMNNKIICNEIIAYFLARIYLFSKLIGLNEDKIRFRQHLPNEMAHYAAECWDLECLVDENWLECIGCANRQNYDLKAHSTIRPLTVKKKNKITKIIPVMKEIGKEYKSRAKTLSNYLEKLDSENISLIQAHFINSNESLQIQIDEEVFQLYKNMIKFDQVYEEFYPHVIEPSFGIDRLLYSIFNQNFWFRDEQRIVLSLPKNLSPYDVAILQLSNDERLLAIVNSIKSNLKNKGYSCYTDYSGVAIGKRYARTDKLGIKYALTVDFDSLNDNKVTIRERDSMEQIRVDINELENYL